MGNRWNDDGVLTWAVLSTVSEVGLERATVDAIAGRMDRSRATLHRLFGTLETMLSIAYETQLQRYDRRVVRLHLGSPAQQVFDVLSELRADLRTPEGLGFRAVRNALASKRDLEEFRRREVEGLVSFRQWLGTLIDCSPEEPALVSELTAVLWSLGLGRAPDSPDPGPITQSELDLAGRLLAPFFTRPTPHPPRDEPVEPLHFTVLGDLL